MAYRGRQGPPKNEPTPICRCRVLYLGSSVPHITKDGLQGIQEPLRELYPSEGISGAKGIDSWLSVWSNGLLLENVDEKQKKFTRFFPIESLHYCAAVRYVLVPASSSGDKERVSRFLPLDSPFARSPSISHPPLFAAILRRTTGIKVLECHVFICKRETPANALVRCCFHAYADSMQARQLDAGAGGGVYGSIYGSLPAGARRPAASRAQSVAEAQIDVIEKVEEWQADQPSTSRASPLTNGGGGGAPLENGHGDELSVYNGDQNHKVWAGSGRSEREVIYNEYEVTGRGASMYGSTGSRVARPRQMVMPAAPPPPPPPETSAKKKVRKQKSRASNGSPVRVNGHGANGHAVNGHSPRANGHHDVNGHEVNGHYEPGGSRSHARKPSGGAVNGHVNGHAPPQRSASALNARQERSPRGERMASQGSMPRPTSQGHGRPAGSPRQRASRVSRAPPVMYPPQLVYGTLPPPAHMHMVPLPPMMPGPPAGYGQAVMTLPYPMVRSGSRAVEEPIYLPSARPLSPTASYQPAHFPHEAYYVQQQYATVDRRRRVRRRPRKDAAESPPNTGIYKRKNHLNEKAFGYSIQQEHRSRSYGSLANLESGGGGGGESAAAGAAGRAASRDGARKSREVQQMMHELDLSADELERSEVRPGMYRGPDSVSQLSHASHHSGFRRL